MEALINSKAISVEQLKAQRATVDRLEAALQAELAILDHYTLEAPFTGMLSFHEQSIGALVNVGTLLTTLDDLSTMKLTFDLPENTLGQIRKGVPLINWWHGPMSLPKRPVTIPGCGMWILTSTRISHSRRSPLTGSGLRSWVFRQKTSGQPWKPCWAV